ncbi:glycoside hydrolase family 15 protein [Thermodesulfobacteriota bacterium]
MYNKISNYGIIGDLHTVALIGLDGSIDWLCFPHINSKSTFAALLDDKIGGRFSVSPAGDYDSFAEYIPDTNILKTTFKTKNGSIELIDFMPIPATGDEELEEKKHEIYRVIKGIKGNVRISVIFNPKFDYARGETTLTMEAGGIVAKNGDDRATLSSTKPLEITDNLGTADFVVSEGEEVWFNLRYESSEPVEIILEDAYKLLDDTMIFWKVWLNKSETGRSIDFTEYQAMINRSALVLKLLYYDRTGSIAAAATTSLPEEIGGERNWDYRYTWVRDTSFTLQALFSLGHMSETEGYIRWLEKLLLDGGVESLQIMYGLDGERELKEEELLHLDGYKGSKPVRIGNEAAGQKQLDIYGELMDAALKLSNYVGKIDSRMWPTLRSICDYVVDHWHEKDSGIWEVRGGPYHFVYSKVMCWVALDRGVTIANRYGFRADIKKYKKTMEEIKSEVLEKGWSKEKQAFLQRYESDALDSSNLLIPILGFLPFSDPRVLSNLEATIKELSIDGFLYRYLAEDGLSGKEGTFLLCTFWLIDNLIALDRLDEAKSLLSRMEEISNHLGLFSEEYDFHSGEQLGNFPQAFTHIGYINSVISLNKKINKSTASEEDKRNMSLSSILFSDKITLNSGIADKTIPAIELISELKNSMNILRGAFFDLDRGRIEYEKMHQSAAYADLVKLSNTLKTMDLGELKTKEEKLSFWINLYNVIVIHGVIELKIKDSVREVRNFFKRVSYQIGDMNFSPDDIEHGILRGNAVPPNALFKQFKISDKRNEFVIKSLEPRIHFALVCGSSSCPPIEVYTPDKIDEELDIAAEAFIGSGGAKLDKERGLISLSRIFKWYGSDLGKGKVDRLNFIAKYLFNNEEKEYLINNSSNIKVIFQEYDWRLNKD